jgi:hypothetical protein
VGFEIPTLVVIGTDCIDSCKSTTIQSPNNPKKQIISIQRFGCTYDYPDSSVSTGSESSDACYCNTLTCSLKIDCCDFVLVTKNVLTGARLTNSL